MRYFTSIFCGAFFLSYVINSQSYACGPFRAQALPYSFKNPLITQQYIGGNLGVVLPSYDIGHLLVAYYQLTGRKIEEQTLQIYQNYLQQKTPLLQCSNTQVAVTQREDGYSAWIGAVKAFQQKAKIEPGLLRRFMTGFYAPEKALLFAANKLEELIKKSDSNSAVLAWLEQQEKVWKTDLNLPEIKTSSPEELYESRYQHASALFYREKFVEAAKEYAALNKEMGVQDKGLALYMELRSHYYLALKTTDFMQIKKALSEAQSYLVSQNSPYLEDLRILAEIVFAKEDPEKYLNFVTESLRKQESSSLIRRWDDLGFLVRNRSVEASEQLDDLASWIFLLKDKIKFSESSSPAVFAWQRWLQTKSSHWLLASAMKADGGFVYANDLLAAVAAVNSSHPAYEAFQFYIINFLQAINRNQEAWQLLTKQAQQKSVSVIFKNRLSDLAFDLAPSLDSLIPFLVQQAVVLGVNGEEELQALSKDKCQSYELSSKKLLQTQPIFNPKITETLEFFPPQALYSFFVNKEQFKSLAKPIAVAVYTRALYLGDQALAVQSGKWLQEIDPRFSASLMDLSHLGNEDFSYAANLLLLRHPSLTVFIELSRRDSSLSVTEIDESGFGDNWWNSSSYFKNADEEKLKIFMKENLWLSAKEKEEAYKVRVALNSKDLSLSVCKAILQRIQEKPSDETIPEAIHHAIKLSKRTGVAPKETLEIFKILHTKYKETKWAKGTRYHYYRPDVSL